MFTDFVLSTTTCNGTSTASTTFSECSYTYSTTTNDVASILEFFATEFLFYSLIIIVLSSVTLIFTIRKR